MYSLLFSESPYLAYSVFLVWLILLASGNRLHYLTMALFIGLLLFYRDYPISTVDSNSVLCPADGRILKIRHTGDHVRLSIFLSIHNVHVQKAPVSGIVESIKYHPGDFHPAGLVCKSDHNEKMTTVIHNDRCTVIVEQVAGVLVRRIVTWLREGQHIGQMQNMGMIKFGSRVNVIVPQNAISKIHVSEGDRVRLGDVLCSILQSNLSA